MKKAKRIIPMLTAAVLAMNGTCSVLGVTAQVNDMELMSRAADDSFYTSNYDHVIDQKINKNYLNLYTPYSVNFNDISFDLRDSKGRTVARLKSDERSKIYDLADGMMDFTGIQSSSQLRDYCEQNNIPLERITDVRIHLDDDKQSFYMSELRPFGSYRLEKGKEDDGRDYYLMDLDAKYSYTFLDPRIEKVGEYTLPADCFHIDICGWYSQSNDYNSGLYVCNSGVTAEERGCIIGDPWMLHDRAGQNLSYQAAPGEYDATFYGNYFWSSEGNLKVADHETKFIKVKAPLKACVPEFFDGSIPAFCFNDDMETDYHAPDGSTYHIDLNGDASQTQFKMMVISGGMIQVILPDPDGNVEFFVDPELKDAKLYYSIDTPYQKAKGGELDCGINMTFAIKKAMYNTDFDFPKNGWTIYDIPEGDYTLRISKDSKYAEKYRVKDPQIHISNTRDLQTRTFDIEEKPVESSSSKPAASSSKKPAATSSKASATSSKKPAATSSKAPATSSKKPAASSSKAPATSSKKPADTSSKAGSTSKPASKLLKGDANCDGKITVTDIAVIATHIKGIKALKGDGLKNANVNGDKEINVSDIAAVAAHIKGIKAIK
ncbi:MAG: dockerin type I repeat-containing protein [Ruminococcus sp.]|nr:dockerin type I repeat-containing protein [Ruminococcus sp.]